MDEKQENHNDKDNRSSLLIVGLLSLPFLYILSIAPVAWLYKTMAWSETSIRTFYMPVVWLHDNTFLKEPLEWYLKLFGIR